MCTFAISVLIGLGGLGFLTHRVGLGEICVSCINTEHMKHNMKMLDIKCRSTEHY